MVFKRPITIEGKAWCYGDNINTDLIYPGRCLTVTDPDGMAKCAMAGLDPKFGTASSSGDMIIAGVNFGSGSSREQAAICLKHKGISAVVAVSFARIFYRNIINQGIPAIISEDAYALVSTGDNVKLDLNLCQLENKTTGKLCNIEPIPEFLLEIINDGGIIQNLRKKNKNNKH
jgi:3-isopropylmalate/(R)-2-methylmalate dehydratase small subunit